MILRKDVSFEERLFSADFGLLTRCVVSRQVSAGTQWDLVFGPAVWYLGLVKCLVLPLSVF